MGNTTTGNITVYTHEKPDVYAKNEIYDPNNINGTGKVVPRQGSLVIDTTELPDGTISPIIWVVESVNSETLVSTLASAQMLITDNNNDSSLTSIVSYGNDIFRAFYDTRTSPMKVSIDSRLVVYGGTNVSYRLVRYPGESNETIISNAYDTNGNLLGNMVPMVAATVPNIQGELVTTINASICTPCYVSLTTPLLDGEHLRIDIFDTHGAQTATVIIFAKASSIVNDVINPNPTIISMTLSCTQQRGNNEFFIFQKQSVDSLNITAILNYDDGHSREVYIDNQRTYLYGLEDFVASYPGLQQSIMVKYYLGANESLSQALSSTNSEFVTVEASLVVISNKLAAGVKISVIPQYNANTNLYSLAYYMYTTDRNSVTNVTNLVTIMGTPFSGSAYGAQQNLTLAIDMSKVFPTAYTTSLIYQQNVVVILQPYIVTVKYIIMDSTNNNVAYGVDATNSRRPAIYYDGTLQQYFIPTSLFGNAAAVINSFYTNANAPYNTTLETQPPTPTHFVVRDVNSGNTMTPVPIPIASYAAPFNLVGPGANGALVNSTTIVEFLEEINSSTYLILYGVPVDCSASTYN